MASGFLSIPKIPELRKRILFTLGFLAVYRLGVFVPVPGTNRTALKEYFEFQGQNSLFGVYDMFSGGALEQFSVFTLGIMPYVSASIILQLLAVVVPTLDRLQKEGETGRRKINQYTRYGTILIAVVQGLAAARFLESLKSPTGGLEVVPDGGWGFRLLAVTTLAAGTAFIMWMGEQISERGIGNGISLIIFAGIIARFPAAVAGTLGDVREGNKDLIFVLLFTIFMLGVIAFIIFCERGQRRIPVQYAKRVVGRRVYGGQNTHLPLKINSSGVIPPIFSSSIMAFPATIASFWSVAWLQDMQGLLDPGGYLYNTAFAFLTVFFCYFYTAVTFNPVDVAENLKKHGGYIPGIRPGKSTAEYIDHVLNRLTLGGAVYVTAVCILPNILIAEYNVNFYFGGTSLLIVVGVALDTVAQIESHLLTRHYDGLMGAGGSRIRGRASRRTL